jgi:hypothetical protein
VGKHSAPNTERSAEPEAERTQILAPVLAQVRSEVEKAWPAESPSEADRTVLLSPVPPSEPERSKAPIRIAILVGVVATVLLSALVWGVNRRSESHITALNVEPPSLSATSGGMLDIVVTPDGSAPTASPVVSISVPATGTASLGASPTPVRQPAPTGTSAVVAQPPTPPQSRPPTTQAAPAPARLTAQFQKVSGSRSSYTGKYTIMNQGGTAAKGWSLVVTFSGSGTLSLSEAHASSSGNNRVTFTNGSANGTVSAGGSVSFTFIVRGEPAPTPIGCAVNGGSC